MFSFLITYALALFVFLLATLFARNARADFFNFVDLKEVSINYRNYSLLSENSRNLLIYPEHPKEGINLNLNLSLVSYLYWDNTIESLTTSSQYRSVGLQTRFGMHLFKQLDLGLYHHSQHVLDDSHTYINKFPSEDAIELKINIYTDNTKDTIF